MFKKSGPGRKIQRERVGEKKKRKICEESFFLNLE